MSVKNPVIFSFMMSIKHQILLLSLLRTSMSLSFSEKSRILNDLHTLSPRQVQELIATFKDERAKFIKLTNEPNELKIIRSIIKDIARDWQDIESIYDIPPLLSEEQLIECLEVLQDKDPSDYFDVLNEFWGYSSIEDEDINNNNDIDTSTHNEDELVNDNDLDKTDHQEHDNERENSFEVNDDKSNEDEDDCEETNGDADDIFKEVNDNKSNEDEDDSETMDAKFTNIETARYDLLKTLNPSEDSDKDLEEQFTLKKTDLPETIITALKKTVIGQDEALEKLVTTLYYHKLSKLHILSKTIRTKELTIDPPENSLKMTQLPIFLMGDTGTGKTHLIKSITEQYDIDCVLFDASTFVPTGIVGTSLDTLGRIIYEKSKKDIKRAEYMVVFLDEFDKLFINQDNHNNRLSVATQLLTMLEGSMPMPIEHHKQENYPTHLNTNKMLFILSGSFNIQKTGKAKQPIGFHNPNNAHQKHHQLSMTELGLPDEMAGRMGQVIALNSLSDDDYLNILYHSPTSPYIILQNQLKLTQCTVELPAEIAKTLIADNQSALQTFGSRGLYQAFNQLPCITRIMMEATKAPNQHFVIELP